MPCYTRVIVAKLGSICLVNSNITKCVLCCILYAEL